MASKNIDTDLVVEGTVNATTLQEGGVPAIISSDIDDVVEISQTAYTALGGSTVAGRLYLITS